MLVKTYMNDFIVVNDQKGNDFYQMIALPNQSFNRIGKKPVLLFKLPLTGKSYLTEF